MERSLAHLERQNPLPVTRSLHHMACYWLAIAPWPESMCGREGKYNKKCLENIQVFRDILSPVQFVPILAYFQPP